MRIALFGGSFDPIHEGHVALARRARRRLTLDRVIFLPTAQPPHKPEQDWAPALARFVMVELAVLGEPGFEVSDFEMTPGRTAYTVDTVEHFRALYPSDTLLLLIGSDSLADLPNWRRWRELVAVVELAVAVRPGWEAEPVLAAAPPEIRGSREAGRLHLLAEEPLPFASSELRAQLSRGDAPPPGALPELVLEYLRKYRLYR